MVKYQLTPKPKQHLGKLAAVLVAMLVIVATGFVLFHQRHQTTPVVKTAAASKPTTQSPAFSQVQGHYLFNGTTVWARGIEHEARRADGSYDYAKPFSQLNTFNRASYDAWMTDFECPITNNTVPYETQIKDLVFNCRPEFLAEASKYFNLYDLANNHTDNQGGAKGLQETRQHLDATPGVQYYGSFDPSVASDVCEVVALPIRLQKSDKSEVKGNLPVAMCAWHYFYRTPLAGEIEVMKPYADVMPVIAFAEMGTEYHPAANETQVNIAHTIVDQGPEFLIANNPHWVQNTEVYKNKLIVYSTGNFIFDQLDTETQRSASIDVTATAKYDDNLAKWLALGDACAKFHDDCLQQAQKQNLKKVHLDLRYAAVAGQGGFRKITHKADAATQAAVEQRLNWATTLKQLGQN